LRVAGKLISTQAVDNPVKSRKLAAWNSRKSFERTPQSKVPEGKCGNSLKVSSGVIVFGEVERGLVMMTAKGILDFLRSGLEDESREMGKPWIGRRMRMMQVRMAAAVLNGLGRYQKGVALLAALRGIWPARDC